MLYGIIYIQATFECNNVKKNVFFYKQGINSLEILKRFFLLLSIKTVPSADGGKTYTARLACSDNSKTDAARFNLLYYAHTHTFIY